MHLHTVWFFIYMKNIVLKKENVDYENLNGDDDMDKNPVHQLQTKGM